MEKKLDRRVRYTRRVIKESFVRLLEQKPLSRITVTEICETADINRATFYAHYADQYDLLTKIEEEVTADLVDYLGMNRPDFQITNTTVETLVKILDYIRHNANIISLLLGPAGDPGFRDHIISTLQDAMITEWTALQGMRPDDAEYAFTFVLIGAVGVIQKWIRDGMKKSSRELAEMIIRLALNPVN